MSAFSWFWLGFFVFTLLMVGVMQRSAAYADGGLLFGVTLPVDKVHTPAVQSIQKTYRRQCRISLLESLLACWPPLLFPDYPSVQMAYLFVWILFLLYWTVFRPFYRTSRILSNCKRECGWTIPLASEPYKDDAYWKYGMFYSNPHDPAFTVPGRMCNRSAFNLGNRKARITFWALMAATAAVLIGVLAPLFLVDFNVPRFVLEKQELVVDYPLFGTSVPYEEMKSILLVPSVPEANYHINGGGTDVWRRGTFQVAGQKADYFIYVRRPPYIDLTLTDGKHFYYNEAAAFQTRADYAALRKAVHGDAAF